MKVIIYTRQSKHRDESVSHELQENACRSFAKSKGWEVVRVLNEKGVSGRTIAKRKEFQTALKMIEDKEAEGLLVWRWSRFARNTLDALITLKSIEEEAKGQVHCALEQIDRSAMGKFSLTMTLGMAELESNVKGEQWNEALMLRLNKGLPPSGKVQFGYDKVDGSYVPNADAETVKEAYARYTAGEGARTICEDFTARGLAAAGPAGWHPRGFFDLLDKSFYAGEIVWTPKKGEEPLVFPGAHEPLLTPAQWANYKRKRQDRKTHARPRNPKWMLSGLVVCGLCGGKMLSHMARGVPNLMCATYNAQGKAGCKGIFRKRSQVQLAVTWWLGSHLEEWASIMPTNDEARLAAEKDVAEAEAAKDAAQGRIDSLISRAVRFDLPDADIAGPLAEFRAELAEAKAEVERTLAVLGEFTPVTSVDEQISTGALLMGFSSDRPRVMGEDEDGVPIEEEPEIPEAAIAQYREALSKIIEKVIVHPPTGTSPRDPERDHRAEIEIVPVRLP